MLNQQNNVPAGFFDEGMEFVAVGDEVFFSKDKALHDIEKLDLRVLENIRIEMEDDRPAMNALNELNLKDEIARIKQYLKCCFGDFDNRADVTPDGVLVKEYVHCSARGTCKHEGKLCLNFFPARNGNLTQKEIQVIKLTVAGLGNKQIAAELNIEITTVATHMSHIQYKTGCPTKPSIVAYAFRHNLI